MEFKLVVTKMKFLCFLLFCAIQSTLSDFNDGSSDSLKPPVFLLGLLKDSEMGILKCSGVFITPDTLVTTAECFMDQNMVLKVSLSPFKNGTVLNYKIKSVRRHENYNSGPSKNDIALVVIDGQVPDEAIMSTANVNIDRERGSIYSVAVKFINDRYQIEAKKVRMLSNAACTRILKFYVPKSKICTYSHQAYHFKENDQGSPLVYNIDGKNYLLGRYVIDTSKTYEGVRIMLYQAIFPQLNWINIYTKKTQICSN